MHSYPVELRNASLTFYLFQKRVLPPGSMYLVLDNMVEPFFSSAVQVRNWSVRLFLSFPPRLEMNNHPDEVNSKAVLPTAWLITLNIPVGF